MMMTMTVIHFCDDVEVATVIRMAFDVNRAETKPVEFSEPER